MSSTVATSSPRQITMEQIERLEIFPRTAVRVQEIAQDPQATFDALERCVAMDQVLGARVLRVANSPYYRVSREIGTLGHAISLMGFREVQRIALTVALLSKMETSALGEVLWQHAVQTGCVARRMARAVGLAEAGDVFVAGVLHDLGKLVLLQVYEQDYEVLLQDEPTERLPLIEAELFGVDHAALGAMVLERWRLPRVTVRSVQNHHQLSTLSDPALGRPNADLVVAVADEASHLLQDGVSDGATARWVCHHAANARLGLDEEALTQLVADSRADWLAMR
ncbi:MAG: HDOD domain-containing protein [Myxococcota bacterium]